MLTADQLNDTAITHSKGLVGSVMDYCPINIAPKGKKQGDYYSTTLGPYDYWAIEYAYKPADGDEASELKKIAARAPEHDLVYATDEDALLNDDPYVNRWDLGSDPCAFGKGRIELAEQPAQGPGRPRGQGRRLLGADPACVPDPAPAVGRRRDAGLAVHRRPVGLPRPQGRQGAHDPIVPIPGAKQRECLKFLVDCDPERRLVPLLAGPAPPAGHRAVASLG